MFATLGRPGGHLQHGTDDTWFEPTGILHLLAEKASATNAAETLAIFITEENGGPLVIPEP
jgi:hypothetical protein